MACRATLQQLQHRRAAAANLGSTAGEQTTALIAKRRATAASLAAAPGRRAARRCRHRFGACTVSPAKHLPGCGRTRPASQASRDALSPLQQTHVWCRRPSGHKLSSHVATSSLALLSPEHQRAAGPLPKQCRLLPYGWVPSVQPVHSSSAPVRPLGIAEVAHRGDHDRS